MKKLSVLAALALVALVVVLSYNTARFTSRQIEVSPIEPLSFDEQAAAERLAGALRFESISHQNPARTDEAAFRALHDYLAEQFPLVHERLERRTGAELGDDRNLSLLYTWNGGDAQLPILLMAHLDVVPVEPASLTQWTQPPFAGEIDDGYVWGRGALDIKNGALALLEAVEHLLAQGFEPSRTIYIALGYDEEVGGERGAAPIAEYLRSRGVRLEFVLDEGGAVLEGIVPGVDKPVAFVAVAEKGYVSLELLVELSEGGHSSMPPPTTAVGILAAAVHRLEENPFPARLDGGADLMLSHVGPEMPLVQKVVMANRWLFAPLIVRQLAAAPSGNATVRTTLAATMIEGGVKENVLPTTARAVVNCRILPGDSVASVMQRVIDTIDDKRVSVTVLDGSSEPSPVSDVQSESFQQLNVAIRQVFPEAIVAPGVLTGATDSKHYADLAQNVYRFLPSRLAQSDLARIHGANERIGIADYANIVRFLVQLIRNTAGELPASS